MKLMQLCGWISYCHHKDTILCFYKVLVPYRSLYSPSLSGLIQLFISIRALNVENWITGLVCLFLKIDRCKIHFCSYEFLQGGVCVCVCVCLVTQLYLSLCDLMDCSLPSSSVHGILQARILEWVAIPFARESSQTRDWTQVSQIAGGFFTVWATRERRFL